MRLDARKGDRGYDIYDAKRCDMPTSVIWCDDTTAQWGRRLGFAGGEMVIETVQEERITIYLARKLIIFNEVDLGEPELDQVVEGLPRTTDPTT